LFVAARGELVHGAVKKIRLVAIRRCAAVCKPCDLPLKNGGGEKNGSYACEGYVKGARPRALNVRI
jgi:hypothetical protein